jgi:hypothetical protein
MCVIGEKKNKGGGTGVGEWHSRTCLIVILQHRHVCRTPFVHRNECIPIRQVYQLLRSHFSCSRADAGRMLRRPNEKVTCHKLNFISRWVAPRFYGENEWFGGRAFVFPDEGWSLSDLKKLPSLSLVERCDSRWFEEGHTDGVWQAHPVWGVVLHPLLGSLRTGTLGP